MYAKILVPLDGSALAERAIPHAVGIARATGAEVILLQVVQAPLGSTPEAGQEEETRAFQDAAARDLAYLGKIAAGVRDSGVAVRHEVIEGPASDKILATAHKENVDILVMSTHGRGGVSKLLLGSVADKVVCTTKRPVMLVKPERVHAERVEEADAILSAH